MEFIEMNKIDIDRIQGYTYDQIFNTFKEVFHNLDKKIYLGNGQEMTDNERLNFLADLMSYIEDEKLLNGAIDIFKNMNYLIDADSKYEEFINQLSKEDYSDFDFVKIKAIVFSILTRYNLTIHQYNFLNLNWNSLPLQIFLKDRIVEHNYSNIVNLIDINGTINYVDSLKKLSRAEQIERIEYLISVSDKIHFKNNISLKSKSSIYLENERDRLIRESNLESNKHSNLINETQQNLSELTNSKTKHEKILEGIPFKIGLLFAKKEIYRKTNSSGIVSYFHLTEEFESISKLSKHLKLTRQYINDTFSESNTNHNLYNEKKMKIVIDYCNENKITIHQDYQDKYDVFIQKQS